MRDLATPADCRRLVEWFYMSALGDDDLGPIFESRIADWDHHFDRLTGFWAAILFSLPTYHGDPIAAHRQLGLTPALFERWLALWQHSIATLFRGPNADKLIVRADRIAAVMQRRLAEAS